jgi:acetolactate synthase-1/2/3 large subunit
MNGAELTLRTAVASGIELCFANPGTTEIPLVAAIDNISGLRPVLGLFEGVCTGAADGYARVTGRPAMTLLHLGPGFANGIANLHNARRAGSPVFNLIGEHATWHQSNDPPLAMDIEALASTVSSWQKRCVSADGVSRDTADAVGAARKGVISSLIMAHDLQQAELVNPAVIARGFSFDPVDPDVIERAARIIKGARKAALLLDGRALRTRGLEAAARIGTATGCDLLMPTFPGYLDRGAGRPVLQRIPYFPEPAVKMVSEYEAMVLAGAREPVTFFGYPGIPGRLLREDQRKFSIVTAGQDVIEVLEAMADLLGAPPLSRSGSRLAAPSAIQELPGGRLTPEKVCACLAALQPEDAIVVDEGLTTAFAYYRLSAGSPPHGWTSVTGGAIGYGMPCAVGAALAAPGRKIINFQADGSALYTVQALWTEAREALDIVTLICSNRSYHIVEMELERAGIPEPGRGARALTTFAAPGINWVQVARGFGVPGVRVDTADVLARELAKALKEDGPCLIEIAL